MKGSSFVYNRYLAPAFAEHEADIDAALGNLRSQATSSLTDALGYVWKAVQQQLNVRMPCPRLLTSHSPYMSVESWKHPCLS